MALSLTIADELKAILSLGLIVARDLEIAPASEALHTLAADHCRVLARRYAGKMVGDVPGVDEARALYRRLGLDPTKVRPSSEALLRRALKGETLPAINTLVDAGNLCSLEFQLPYGLYDLDAIEGPISVRVGHEGEGYAGIRKEHVNVGGRIALVDERGPFGNPSSDSARTMVTTETCDALVVVFAPAAADPARLDHVVAVTAERIVRFAGGVIAESRRLRGGA